MITDKLLAFADKKAITTTADSDVIDFGKGGDEIARTMNIVCQIDDPGNVTPTAASVSATLKGSADGSSWDTVVTFPAVTVENMAKGKRVVEFAKLPLGIAKYSRLKLAMTVSSGPLVGATYSAWLTPSAELDK